MPLNRICDAVDLLLSLQNRDGGYASFELSRGWKFLECLNPSEIFGTNLVNGIAAGIVVDSSYTECTCSALLALKKFKELYPGYRRSEIQ